MAGVVFVVDAGDEVGAVVAEGEDGEEVLEVFGGGGGGGVLLELGAGEMVAPDVVGVALADDLEVGEVGGVGGGGGGGVAGGGAHLKYIGV